MSMAVANSQTYLDQEKANPGCCGTNSGLERKLIALSACLAVMVIALVVALAVVASNKSSSTDDTTTTLGTMTTPEEVPLSSSSEGSTDQICQDSHCQEAGLYFSSNMNKLANPCEDFHEFVCGNWIKENPIPEDKGRYGVFDGLRDDLGKDCIDVLEKPAAPESPTGAFDNARAFYQSCLKTESVSSADGESQLASLLSDVDISADLSKVPADFTWTKTLSKIVRSYGSNFILSFGIGADVKNTKRNMISLDQPSSFGLGRSFLLEGDSARMTAYKKYAKESLCLLSKGSCPQMEAVVEDIVEFEVQMAKLTRSPIERRDASTWYFPMNITDLDLKVPEIPFLEYVTDILSGSGQSISEDTVVIVKEEAYFFNLTTLINVTSTKPTGVVHNYLAWRLVQSLGPSLSKVFRDLKFDFDKVNAGIQKEKENADRCFDLTNSYLGHAVGSMYIDKIGFNESAKRDLEDMVEFLSKAFRTLVDENDWMDPPTKMASKLKLDKMVDMIGYPEWTRSSQELNEYYKDLKPLDKENFFESYKKAMTFATGLSFAKLGKENNRTSDWNSAASIVNAFYSPSHNSITFPAGILQIPFYGSRLKVLNYGAIGYVIGHEITHGFDDSGRQYDGDGSLNLWWTPGTLAKFTERKNCFIEQYSNITDPLSGLQLNGGQTIGENIADNGGIRESYKAYEMSGREALRLPGLEEFDDRQLFFVSSASIWCSQFRKEDMINQINQGVHSPGMYRAYIPLANTREFAEAFNCPLTSKMNPEKRCVIW